MDDKKRNSYLLRQFGITLEQYNDILEKQGGGCALCAKTAIQEGQNLAVDHDHKTGEVRGVLCRYCNHRVIGRHRDPDLLHRMARYLEEGKTGLFVPVKKRPTRRKRKKK